MRSDAAAFSNGGDLRKIEKVLGSPRGALRTLQPIQAHHPQRAAGDFQRRGGCSDLRESTDARDLAQDVDVAEIRGEGEVEAARQRAIVPDERKVRGRSSQARV